MERLSQSAKSVVDEIAERCKANATVAHSLPLSAEEERSVRIEHVRQQSEIPEKYRLSCWLNYDVDDSNRAAFEAMRAFETRGFRPPGVGLYGQVGSGKTRLMAALANAAIIAEKRVAMLTVSDLILRLRATFNTRDESELTLIGRLVRTPVLIIDDLGKEQITEWSAQNLFEFFNQRYNHGLPVVIAANAPLKTLRATKYERVPDSVDPSLMVAVLDRIYEMTGPWLEIGGKSRRRAS